MEAKMILDGEKQVYNGQVVQVNLTTNSGLLVEEHQRSIEITVPCIARTEVVTVYKPDNMFGQVGPARINWSGCGSQDTDATHFFIEALCLAKTYAEELNKAYGVTVTE